MPTTQSSRLRPSRNHRPHHGSNIQTRQKPMSEIRRTTTIEEIEAPHPEPLISLSSVLTAVGWIAYQGTKLAVKGAVAGTVLAYKGSKALTQAASGSRRKSTSLSEIERIVDSAENAEDAVRQLAGAPGLETVHKDVKTLTLRLKTLVAANDKAGVAVLGRELVRARQARIHAQLVPIVADACRAIGFDSRIVDANTGLVVAKGSGSQTVSVEVAKGKEGDVRIHFDSDGFRGNACAYVALDPLQKELEARGVRVDLSVRRRKNRRPAFDGNRLPIALQARVAR